MPTHIRHPLGDLAADAGHDVHGVERVVAARGLSRQHDTVAAVEHRVGLCGGGGGGECVVVVRRVCVHGGDEWSSFTRTVFPHCSCPHHHHHDRHDHSLLTYHVSALGARGAGFAAHGLHHLRGRDDDLALWRREGVCGLGEGGK